MIKDERKGNGGVSKLGSMPINTIIGNGIVFKGDIHGESIIRIEGKVEGNIKSREII